MIGFIIFILIWGFFIYLALTKGKRGESSYRSSDSWDSDYDGSDNDSSWGDSGSDSGGDSGGGGD